ncbi:MAG: hypothetical protein ACOC5T_07590, partial [Elusimicrobiota bacterium]
TTAFAFLTADPRAGIPLDDWELEEIENMRRNGNHRPQQEEVQKESEEKTMSLDNHAKMKEIFKNLKEQGFFDTYATFEEWKQGKRNLKKFRDGKWVD